MNLSEFVNAITSGALDSDFGRLYGGSSGAYLAARARYISAAERFSRLFPQCGEIRVFSVPESMRLIGTDCGKCTLSAAVSRDITAFVTERDEAVIRIVTEGGSEVEIDIESPDKCKSGTGDFSSIVSRIATGFSPKTGISCYIFPEPDEKKTAYAALLVTALMNAYYSGGKLTPDELATIAAEAVSADVKQLMPCASGGFTLVGSGADTFSFDMEAVGYTLCAADTGECVPHNAASIAGAAYDEMFWDELPMLMKSHTPEEIISAAYILGEERRARLSAESLENGDTEGFFAVFGETSEVAPSPLASLAYTVGRRLLSDCGAVRICSDGTLAAFVPNYLAADFTEKMNDIFGKGFCRMLKIRTAGVSELKLER